MNRVINLLQEWSIPLITGVFVALVVANQDEHFYHVLIETPLHELPEAVANYEPHHEDAAAPKLDHDVALPDDHELDAAAGGLAAAADDHQDQSEEGAGHGLGHYFTLHFLINDVFMVFFFGIAAKEITESILPGGSLNPPSKAVNPLLGTIGGVLGPIGFYFLLNHFIGKPEWSGGWGIPTATDIALAWLVARFVFGPGHPAVSFLLLLAVADDAIGLGIIAFAYPTDEPQWLNTLWIIPGMLLAFSLRRLNVRSWAPYVLGGGLLSWWGLFSANLHPALALVPIVPFLPAGKRDTGLFAEEADYEEQETHGHHHSTLEMFEHQLKAIVDFGLFFFAFANAGVAFTSMSNLTWIVLFSLFFGKMVGITGFSWIGSKIGFPLPTGMKLKQLFMASIVAAVGLTVALFVCAQAFKINTPGEAFQGSAKMGALFSGGVAIFAIILGKILRIREDPKD